MRRAVIIVIDGLGAGSKDGQFNTLNSILENMKTPKFSNTLDKLANLADDDKILPAYEGADSYKGHFEMIGLSANSPEVFLDEYVDFIRTFNTTWKIEETYPGVLVINNGVLYASSNVEAELGGAINLIADLDKIKWEEAISIGRNLSNLLRCQRVIVMGNHSISMNNIKNSIRKRTDYKTGKLIIGIVPSAANMYDLKYKSYHIGRALATYNEDNLINRLNSLHIPISLIGKVSDIFQADLPYVSNIHVVDTDQTADEVKKALNSEAKLIFANFQELDLQGHAGDLKKASLAFEKICLKIDVISELIENDDLLIITGDHGNDPESGSHQHTRELVPFVANQKISTMKFSEKPDLSLIDYAVSNHLLASEMPVMHSRSDSNEEVTALSK